MKYTNLQSYEIFVGIAAIVGAVFLIQSARTHTSEAPPVTRPLPVLTTEEKAFVQRNAAVAALVSYTDRGFEPATTTIHVGDTVRFFNASPQTVLWVSSSGKSYPGQSPCGATGFDTCHSIDTEHFWEFTFTKKGVWEYKNNATPSHGGVVIVE